MKLSEIVERLGLEVRTGAGHLETEVTHGYVSDMLSDVIGNAHEGAVWVTLQSHQNVVAVAIMRSLAGIILIKGREPDEETIRKAEAEGVPILVSEDSAFAVVSRLHDLGIVGG
ncbi:MAG: serine kinase [Candidatus Eisenbacteria sp.]|nr:serine kinase [Candidatus Eisenbacteria bacterium]